MSTISRSRWWSLQLNASEQPTLVQRHIPTQVDDFTGRSRTEGAIRKSRCYISCAGETSPDEGVTSLQVGVMVNGDLAAAQSAIELWNNKLSVVKTHADASTPTQ